MPNNNLTVSGTVGIDGIVPVYDPDARWCWWEIGEIYVGTEGAKRYVPKVNDYVVDSAIFAVYIVDSIDPVSLVANLRSISLVKDNGSFSKDDILFGVGPGTQSDTYLVYLDTSVIPYALTVDARLTISGSMCSFAKIFKGSDASASGKVISKLYDATGTLLTQNIPLELVAIDSHSNYAIKTVSVCYTNELLADGEVVTLVAYGDTGHVVSKRQLLVLNTAFIRSVNISQKYISHISLKSPFLSPSNSTLIEFPINVPVIGLGLIGVVHYSDGTKLEIPVDGSKFRMFGLEQYIGTQPGQRVNLVLSYSLGNTETTYAAVSADTKKITKAYTIVSQVQNGAYSVKLFGYPVWLGPILGYTLRWFMYTLDRNTVYDVTQHVRINANTGAFNPTAYGFLQNLSVSVNLRDVNGSFKSYIHVQSIGITLVTTADERTTNWTIDFDPLQAPQYGISLYAKANVINQNLCKLKVDSGIATFDEWLKQVYYATKPLLDRQKETAPPVPNFFIVHAGDNKAEYPITDWNKELTFGFGPQVNDTLFIEFIRRTPNTDIKLATAGLITYEY